MLFGLRTTGPSHVLKIPRKCYMYVLWLMQSLRYIDLTWNSLCCLQTSNVGYWILWNSAHLAFWLVLYCAEPIKVPINFRTAFITVNVCNDFYSRKHVTERNARKKLAVKQKRKPDDRKKLNSSNHKKKLNQKSFMNNYLKNRQPMKNLQSCTKKSLKHRTLRKSW